MGVMVIMTTLTIILPTDTVDRLLPISVIIVYYTISLDFPHLVGRVIYLLTDLAICLFSLLEAGTALPGDVADHLGMHDSGGVGLGQGHGWHLWCGEEGLFLSAVRIFPDYNNN